jgi:hypothetical protein
VGERRNGNFVEQLYQSVASAFMVSSRLALSAPLRRGHGGLPGEEQAMGDSGDSMEERHRRNRASSTPSRPNASPADRPGTATQVVAVASSSS